jgi:hypothetical protein
MTDKQRHIAQLRQRYAAAIADTPPGEVRLYRDFINAFTRIGNALGLEGQFMSHFGFEQIEQRAKDAMVRMESLERMGT